jgi:hypothetical protein
LSLLTLSQIIKNIIFYYIWSILWRQGFSGQFVYRLSFGNFPDLSLWK